MTIWTGGARVLRGQTLEEFQAGFGEYLGAKFDQAIDDTATKSLYKMSEFGGAMYGAPETTTDPMGNVVFSEFNEGPDSPPVSKAEATETIKAAGLDGHLVASEGMPKRALDILIDRKHKELARADTIARAPNRYAFAGVPLSIGTQILDPVNVAAMFVPGVGEARFAQALGRTGSRALAGTINGVLGSAAVEPLTLMAHTQEQADYTMTDSLTNIAFGGIMGGGLHVGIGAVADRIGRKAPRGTGEVEPTETHTIQTPEREAFRAGLVSSALETATPVEGRAPVAYVMGGGGAAGKGTILRLMQDAGEVPRENVVHIDPDNIKALIPEYGALLKAGDTRAAALVHEESSALAKRILAEASATKRDIVLDRTLARRESGLADIQGLLKAGYDVRLIGITADVDQAVQRAIKRASHSGRVVPEAELRKAHAGFAAHFEEYAALAHEARLYDNSGDTPSLIAHNMTGDLEIRDVEAYNRFRERGKENATDLGRTGGQAVDGAGSEGTHGQGNRGTASRGTGGVSAPDRAVAAPVAADQVVAGTDWKTQQAALRTAVAQMADGRSPEVEPVIHSDAGTPGPRPTLDDFTTAAARTAEPSGAIVDAPARPEPLPKQPETTAEAVPVLEKETAEATASLKETLAGIEAQRAGAESDELAKGLPDDLKAELAEYDDLIKDAESWGKALRALASCSMRS